MLFTKTSLLTNPFFMYLSILPLISPTKDSTSTTMYRIAYYDSNSTSTTTTKKPPGECGRLGSHCPHGTHTLCLYQGRSPQCENPGKSGVTEDEKQEILDTHNHFRGYVADGNETRGAPGPQPRATDMLKMYWNYDLALVAQRWAEQCTNGHDRCRSNTGEPVGQNVLWRRYSEQWDFNWTQVISAWYNEVIYFPNTTVTSYWGNYQYKHYAQVVWAKTLMVGCGRLDYGDPHYEGQYHQTDKIFVCNYSPAGNVAGQPVYNTSGTTCSRCPEGTQCVKGLCDFGPFPPSTTHKPRKKNKKKKKKQSLLGKAMDLIHHRKK